MSARGSRIIGTGSYFPERVMTNVDLEKMVDTSDEWIKTRTGISERRIAAESEACSDLGTAAARAALDAAGVKPEELDGVIMGTISGDMQFPATAVFIQQNLGATNAFATDLSAACSGFIYGVCMAHGLIASGQMDKVLVVGGEVLSKFLDWEDRTTCVLFGDGAGAVVMEACEPSEGIAATLMGSDGSLADLLCIPGGGSRAPLTNETYLSREHLIKMKGDGVFKHAVRAMANSAKEVVAKAGIALDDVALIVPHQANVRIVDAVTERLEFPSDRVTMNLDRFGNTSAGTIPTAFDEAVRAGRVKPGDWVLFVGFGGGFTWGAVLLKHSPQGSGA